MTTPPPTEHGWHIHHEKLFEPITEPLENRIRYIKAEKPSHEQELRLRLIRPVRDNARLEADVQARDEGWAQYKEALTRGLLAKVGTPERGSALDDASAALERAHESGRDILRLHREECEPDCPWNGRTILVPAGY